MERAIVARCHVSFDYVKGEGNKSYTAVAPFKLINNKGIWYLVARDGDKLKTFSFAKIERLIQLDSRFAHEPEIDKMLKEEDGIWLGEEKKEIVFKIAREIAGYPPRKMIPLEKMACNFPHRYVRRESS